MATIYLIRHAETEENRGHIWQGHMDTPLTEGGVQQARQVAEAMKDIPLQAIYSSDLQRALHTAAIIAEPHRLKVIADQRLRELNVGSWQGLTIDDVKAKDAAGWRAIEADKFGVTLYGGGESLRDLYSRSMAAYDQIVARHVNASVAIVTHGGTIRAIIALILGGDMIRMTRLAINNGGITRIEVKDSEPRIRYINRVVNRDSLL